MADKKLPWGLKNDRLAPGSMKSISQSKLKAFNIGSMNIKKGQTKREQEEARKKAEEEEAAKVYEEFVTAFDDAGKSIHTRTWVKGETVQHTKSGKVETRAAGTRQLYKPASKLAELASTFQSSKEVKKEEKDKPPAPWKKKTQEKKKSNLEIFKEELKVIQEERQERHRQKSKFGIDDPSRKSRFEPTDMPPQLQLATGSTMRGPGDDFKGGGSFCYDDTTTTNIYLGNINPKMTETQLCEVFGKYGPLASVKIMWPRSEEERARGRNCGFVAFMNRRDGERAMNALQGTDVQSFEMKLGWGKAVPIPPHPVYIPPQMMELTLPPPPSGLPFNAQHKKHRDSRRSGYDHVPPPDQNGSNSEKKENLNPKELQKTLANAVVKVVIPTERNLLCIIHRMIEFVVREGPMFEAMIMNREINNPMFRFLFENQSPAHVYYRWKLYTILQGESPYQWKTEEFRMFKNGSLWRPPPMNPYTQGMPAALINKPMEQQAKKGGLNENQRDRLEDILRELVPERSKVGDAMVWCMDHAESAEEIVECIAEALSILQTPIPKKVARLFLISDILFNSSAKVPKASFFRKCFEAKMPEIFKDLHDAYEKIDARLRAEQFKQKVMACFRAWEDWAIYPNEFLINLQNIFLGLTSVKESTEKPIAMSPAEDVDGIPIDDLDGLPMDGQKLAALASHAADDLDGKVMSDVDGEPIDNEEVDGIPFDTKVDDVDGQPMKPDSEPQVQSKFKYSPSKWETVDPEAVQAQAMTTSKWDLLDQQEESKAEDEEDLDGQPMEEDYRSNEDDDEEDDESYEMRMKEEELNMNPKKLEERRAKLREIEVKVMKYQDELEAGKRTRKPELSISEQVQHYRRKLVHKEEEKEKEKSREKMRAKHRAEDRERVKEWERARDKERERELRDQLRERDGRRERRDFSSDEDQYSNSEASSMSYRRRRSMSDSPSPTRSRGGGSRSPIASSISLVPYTEGRDSPVIRKRRRSRSKSPRSSRRRSRSPKKSKKSRSRSRSPGRHKQKRKKSKR